MPPAIWIDGRRVPVEGPHVSARDRGLLLADGLFETMRARDGRVFRLAQHLARLCAGLARLDIPAPPALESWIAAAVDDTAAEVSVRVTVTRGVGTPGLAPPLDVRPTVIVAINPMPAVPAATYHAGLSARIASGRRNEHAMTAGLKTLAFTDAVAALLEARRSGADEALFLDTGGHCCEASASNLFAVLDGTLVTPPIACGALPGITRAAVLEIAAALSIPAVERPLEPHELRAAAEAFLTSSLRGIAPLVRLDGQAIGDGRPGAATARVARAYAELVAEECGR